MQTKNYLRKTLALVMAFLMIVTMLPVNVFAAVRPADWNYQTAIEGTDTWPLGAKNVITRARQDQGLKSPSINYVGTYINGDGREVVRLTFDSFFNNTMPWTRLVLKFSKNFADIVEWGDPKTGMYKGQFNGQSHDYNNDTRGIVQFTTLPRSVTGADKTYVQDLKANGNYIGAHTVPSTPMDFVLQNGKSIKDLKEQVLIQARFMDTKYEEVFAVASDAVGVNSYNSYTFTTVLPTTRTNFFKDLNQNIVEVPGPFYGATSYITYNLDGGYIDVLHKQSKTLTGNEIGGPRNQSNPIAYRQSFDASFLDILNENANPDNIVAEVTILNQADEPYGPATTANTVKLKKDELSRDGNLAFLQVAGTNWDSTYDSQYNIKTKKTIAKAGDSIVNTTVTQYNSGISTRVRYYVQKDALEKIIKGKGLKSYSFYTAVLNGDKQGMINFSAQAPNEIKLKKGDKVNLYFNDNQGYQVALTYYDTQKIMVIGKDQFAIDFKDSIEVQGIATGNNAAKNYIWTVPFDMTIPKDTNVSVKGTYNGRTLKTQTLRMTKDNTDLLSFTNPTVEHKPRSIKATNTITGGTLVRTIYRPHVNEIFTADKNITGASNYDRAEMTISIPENTLNKQFSAAKDTMDVVLKSKVTENNTTSEKYVTYKGHKFDTNTPNIAGTDQLKQYNTITVPQLKKDMPVILSNRAVLLASLPGEDVTEQVQAKVTFKPGGPLGDDVSYDKIAPLNKEYLYTYDNETKTFTKNANYKGNGFGELDKDGNVVAGTLDNIKVDATQVIDVDGQKMINYIGHDGRPYDISATDTAIANEQKQALMKRQWPVVEENGSKFIQGKVLIGWTTKKLVDDDNGTAAQKYYKLVEENKVVTNLTDWTKAKTEAYVYNSKSPMEEAITVYGVWGEPAIRLHSNFDKDAAAEGMQEDVDTQVLEKAVIDQLKTNADPTTIDATLKSVYDKNEFKRDGYSLVGFARKADANEPDVNVTGEGLTADNYLRDGDTFKLADTEHNYTFDATKGLDLYAVWKEDFTIKATKAWLDKNGTTLTPKQDNVNALKFALIGRPAVGTFGQEVVLEGATYHPIEGTIKNFTGTDLTWGEGQEAKIKGYDTKGRRMSYLIVELTNAEQEAAFNAGSTNWSDYGIKITEPDPANHVYGHKDQVISFGSGQNVDTFTGATTRLHKTATSPEGINPHGSGTTPKVGYFDTTGYVINVNNKEVVVPYPTIEQGYTGDTTITVNPPEKMVDKITVTLPDNTTAIFKKNEAGTGYETTTEGNTTATLEVTDGKLIITPATPLAKGDVVKAKAESEVAGKDISSEEVTMKVTDRLKSNKPEELKQEKYEKKGEVPISFKVPDNVTYKPAPGTVYTVVTVDDQGNETPTSHTYTIPADGAETIPGTRQTITVPKAELEGKKVIIKAEEPNKTPTNSDKLDLDFKAPTVTPDARDERWRRWADIEVTLDESLEGPMTLTYKENGTLVTKEYDTKEEALYEIERLKLKDNITDMNITAADKFGNSKETPVKYTPIGQTQIIVAPIRAGRNFVIVTATEVNTKVVVNVYEKGTLLDSYKRDKYFDFIGPDKPTPKATVELTFDQANKRQRMRIKDTSGNAYKLQKGDVIDIVGTIGEKGPGYKITNPFTEIVK